MHGRPLATALVVLAALVAAFPASPPAGSDRGPAPAAARGGLPEPDPLLRDLIGFRVRYRDLLRRHDALVRTVGVRYTAWDGSRRWALLMLPRWYGPRNHPPIPLVISPHGRGVTERDNTHFWGGLPAFGPFAVVSPEGQGRRLTLYSWGWRGQIDDLARMPGLLERALPWLTVDHKRVYAVGSSMGGQETLLLAALHPRLLTGASALDSATDMTARYYAFPQLRGGLRLQALSRFEIGGAPTTAPAAYASRSPIHYARRLALAGVPLHIWWSLRDRIVRNQNQESGRLYRTIKRLNPRAPVTRYVGTWAHSKEMHATARLPLALVKLKLIKLDEPLPASVKP